MSDANEKKSPRKQVQVSSMPTTELVWRLKTAAKSCKMPDGMSEMFDEAMDRLARKIQPTSPGNWPPYL